MVQCRLSLLVGSGRYAEVPRDQDTIGAFARERLVADPAAWCRLRSGQVTAYKVALGRRRSALGRNRS